MTAQQFFFSNSGIRWVNVTPPTAQDLWAADAAAGTAVAVGGSGGVIFTSTSGNLNSWTSRSSGTSETIFRFVRTFLRLIAVGTNGLITQSSGADLATWTVRTSGTTQTLRGGANHANIAVDERIVVGDAGTILYNNQASNFTTWTARTSGSTQSLRGAAHNGSIWVVVGSFGTVLTSPDTITWTSRSSPAGTANALLNDVVWNGSRFVACGNAQSGFSGVMSSTDGITWTQETVPAQSYRAVAGASFEAPPPRRLGLASAADVLLSPDGGTWTTTVAPFTDLKDIVRYDSRWIVVSTGGKIAYVEVL